MPEGTVGVFDRHEQLASIDQTLRSLELDRAQRIKAEHAQDAPPAPAHRTAGEDALAGVPPGVPVAPAGLAGSGDAGRIRQSLRALGTCDQLAM